MPTCPRCALLAVAIAAAVFTGCDSNNPGRDLSLVDGVYVLEELSFDPETQALPTADVASQLDREGTTLEIFGRDAEALLRIRDDRGTGRVNLDVGAARGRASFEAVTEDDIGDLADIFLPASFVLTYNDNADVLSGMFSQSGVNLEAFDPSQYRGLRNVRGTLTVRFRRL